jgi:hypothetical protein
MRKAVSHRFRSIGLAVANADSGQPPFSLHWFNCDQCAQRSATVFAALVLAVANAHSGQQPISLHWFSCGQCAQRSASPAQIW